ncbi:MAG: hypothetical protein LBH44_01795 [Treponema sp.]|jgi:hypothetical protein|nr:hypothetical protein [Treponema sp.]
MTVNGCDCTIVVKTAHRETDIPFADETIRGAVSLLEEEASIQGGGVCKAIRKNSGAVGCIVTPLGISTAPLLLSLAMGAAEKPVFVSETRNMYKRHLDLAPMEDTEHFDLIQKRGGDCFLYEGCRVNGFELRIRREEKIKLKLDVCSERPPIAYSARSDRIEKASGELFSGDYSTYTINGKDYKNIYGSTLVSKKEGGTKTEIRIKRALEQGQDLPHLIEEFTITAQLLRDSYEFRQFGIFRITLTRLVLVSDGTEINTSGAVIGPLKYYVTGNVSTEVFTSGEEKI